MVSLLKSEFYQLTHRRAPLIWLASAVILPLLLVLLFAVGDTPDPSVLPEESRQSMIIYAFNTLVLSIAPYLLIGITITSFNNELKNRLVINSIGYGKKRSQLYFAKFISSFLFALCFVIISCTLFIIIASTMIKLPISMLAHSIVIDMILPSIPIWIAFLALYIMLLFWSESVVPLWISLFVFLFLTPLLMFASRVIPWLSDALPYWLPNLSPLSPVSWGSLNATPIIATCYTILFTAIGLYHFKHKEIK